MSKAKNTPARPAEKGRANAPAGGAKKAGAAKPPATSGSAAVRETVESVVIAFVLAFLFRTFEAEAFVIPTGSMAPTLMGQHKDFECPSCGYRYQVGASEQDGRTPDVLEGTCPMCRRPADLSARNPEGVSYPIYNGDRILVGKFAYQFNDPERWDVAVFRYPGDAQTNYIKRLVGLPGETIRIQYGNIYVRRDDGEFQIARKPPDKMLAVLQPVFDNDLMPRLMERYELTPRWHSAGGFEPVDKYRAYETDGSNPDTVWLHYQHRTPTRDEWRHLLRDGRLPQGAEIAPRAIDDFTAYNTSRTPDPRTHMDREPIWVGDLAVGCTVDVRSGGGELLLQLVRGGTRFLCQINLNDGMATLSMSGDDGFHPQAKTALRGPGKHEVLFSNCDDQLRLWIDGTLVIFGDSDAATCYDGSMNHDLSREDLTPASIGARAATVQVSHLKIARDLYYIARPQDGPSEGVPAGTMKNPAGWYRGSLRHIASGNFKLGANEFLMLGDNSAMSKDSRLWPGDGLPYAVTRDLLIGKAIFIYWPHSWETPIPFWPNLSRMGFVR